MTEISYDKDMVLFIQLFKNLSKYLPPEKKCAYHHVKTSLVF